MSWEMADDRPADCYRPTRIMSSQIDVMHRGPAQICKHTQSYGDVRVRSLNTELMFLWYMESYCVFSMRHANSPLPLQRFKEMKSCTKQQCQGKKCTLPAALQNNPRLLHKSFFPKDYFYGFFPKLKLKRRWKFGKESQRMTFSKGLNHERGAEGFFSATGSNCMNHFKSLLLNVPES